MIQNSNGFFYKIKDENHLTKGYFLGSFGLNPSPKHEMVLSDNTINKFKKTSDLIIESDFFEILREKFEGTSDEKFIDSFTFSAKVLNSADFCLLIEEKKKQKGYQRA